MNPRPATKEAYPLGSPDDRFPAASRGAYQPIVKKHRMSVEVLDETIRQAMQSSGREVSFVWQGGEPTLMGLDFFVEPRWKYGNLMETSLPSLVSKEKCKEFENRKIILLPECKDCRWLEYCYGGCLKYRDLIKSEPEEKFYFCESYKVFFRMVFRRSDNWRRK